MHTAFKDYMLSFHQLGAYYVYHFFHFVLFIFGHIEINMYL